MFMAKIVSLCPACAQCPTVEVRDREVVIGEGANLVKLTVDEWNVLVRAIKAGDLDELTSED
jgi:hypothetical protein